MDRDLVFLHILYAILAVIVFVVVAWFIFGDPVTFRQYETLVTESVEEARQFQRECWQKNEASVRVSFLVEAWELQCSWVEQK